MPIKGVSLLGTGISCPFWLVGVLEAELSFCSKEPPYSPRAAKCIKVCLLCSPVSNDPGCQGGWTAHSHRGPKSQHPLLHYSQGTFCYLCSWSWVAALSGLHLRIKGKRKWLAPPPASCSMSTTARGMQSRLVHTHTCVTRTKENTSRWIVSDLGRTGHWETSWFWLCPHPCLPY